MWKKLVKRLQNIVNLDTVGIPVTIFVNPEVQRFIIKLNTANQLFNEGIDINGKVTGVYSYTTAMLKGDDYQIYNGLVGVKKLGEPYNFYDTGEFFESFHVIVYKDGFTINADTEKPDRNLLDYGPILGLTDESKHELAKKMLPFLLKEVRKQIFK